MLGFGGWACGEWNKRYKCFSFCLFLCLDCYLFLQFGFNSSAFWLLVAFFPAGMVSLKTPSLL